MCRLSKWKRDVINYISIHIKPESFFDYVLSISRVTMKNPLYSNQQHVLKEQKKIKYCCMSLTENSNCASLKIDTLTVTDTDNFFDRINYNGRKYGYFFFLVEHFLALTPSCFSMVTTSWTSI